MTLGHFLVSYGERNADTIDVYEALDMFLPGLFAYRSILAGGIQVTASGFFKSLPSLAKILLKETPMETVRPSSNLMRYLISCAIFSPFP